METKKTKITDFINYIEEHHRVSSKRLLGILKRKYGNDESVYLEDITDKAFLLLINVGVKTLAEFTALKREYLSHGDEPLPKETGNHQQENEKHFLNDEELAAWKRQLKISAWHWDLLAQACEGWTSAEEGDKRMIKALYERDRVKIRRFFRKVLKFFGLKLKELEIEKKYYHTFNGVIIDLMYCNYPPYSDKEDIAGIAGEVIKN
jgi:hypothetical protein